VRGRLLPASWRLAPPRAGTLPLDSIR